MLKKAALVLLTLFFCLLLLEAGLRFAGRRPTNLAEGIVAQHGDSFRLKKNMTKVVRWPAYTYTVHTNALGFRDRSIGPRDLSDKPLLVFLGASDVFGNGVDYEDSFVGIFAEEAARRGMNVLNLAVGGHYFLDQEDQLRDFMTSTGLTPATVFHCVNALHIPKFDRKNTHIIVKSGYAIDRSGWRLTYLRLMAGNISSAFCFFRDAVRRIQERHFHFEVNEKSPEFLQIYAKDNPIRRPERIRQFKDDLERFENECRGNGIELVYVYVPLSDSFRLKPMARSLGLDPEGYDAGFYEQLMREHCERTGVPLINPRPALQRRFEEGLELRFKLDPHFNPLANRIIGECLVDGFFRGSRPRPKP